MFRDLKPAHHIFLFEEDYLILYKEAAKTTHCLTRRTPT